MRSTHFTPRAGLTLALACLAPLALHAAAPASTPLTIERLFAAPELSGPTLRGAQISPDGRLVTYLKGATDDPQRMDLWAYDIRSRQHRLLVEATRLAPEVPLSAEEAGRRERQRISTLGGIVEYSMSASSRLVLVPLGGDLYVCDLSKPAATAVRRLTQTPAYETDARFSPRGTYVSFVRDQNLWVYELASGTERAVTREGGGTLSFGMAEFVAQEEMDRDTGYWWAPDERRIAYARVDEAGVALTERFEILADRVQVVQQRYPAAGGANARVELHVASLDGSPAVRADLGGDADVYLARVDWFPEADALAVQRQSRDQRTLDLLRIDPANGRAQTILTERSDSWVELGHDLAFLPAGRRFVWASSRSGYRHLYLYGYDGRLVRPLTQGEWLVVGDGSGAAVKTVDERAGRVWFMANRASPLERQLYSVELARAAEPVQVSRGSGWHSVAMAEDASAWLDTFSTADAPPSVTLHDRQGRRIAELLANRIEPGHPYHPYLAAHVSTEFGTLAAADGQSLQWQLLKPKHLEPGRRYPVLVDVYGGPGVQQVTRSWSSFYSPLHQLLVQRGYVVFALDNRGSGARGKAFEAASLRRLGSVEVEDQLAGARMLRTLPYVDPARIGIFGWSYGGYMALLTILRGPDLFAAAVAGAPVTDWKLYDTHYTERYLGKPQDNPAGYAAGNVLELAPTLRRPLLLVHGMADDNVLFTHSTTLMKVLQDANRPFELMTYPGAKHRLLRHNDTGPHALHAMLAFFDEHLHVSTPHEAATSQR